MRSCLFAFPLAAIATLNFCKAPRNALSEMNSSPYCSTKRNHSFFASTLCIHDFAYPHGRVDPRILV